MPENLILPAPTPLGSRRTGGGGGAIPRRNRSEHGSKLQRQLQAVIPPREIEGVNPDLVFKIKTQARPDEATLSGRDLQMLGETADFQYFVFTSGGGESLSNALTRYIETGEFRTLFDNIEDIEPYGSEDRAGEGIERFVAGFDGSEILDVLVWPSSTYQEAAARAQIIEDIVSNGAGTILFKSVSIRRTYIRVLANNSVLTSLLNEPVVELVRTPPVPFLDFRDWWDSEFPAARKSYK
jgi:hypothetical protein